MARIEGVDLPRNKRVEVGLNYLFGVGPTRSNEILTATGINPDTRVKDLTEAEVNAIREYIAKNWKIEGDLRRIFAAIVVDRDGHKAIVIGKGGEQLKRIATEARHDMERLFDGKVYLEIWVKVKSGWNDDERLLKSLGYE